MNKHIHFFGSSVGVGSLDSIPAVGLRGREAIEFSQLDLPILPGFVIDVDGTAQLRGKKNLRRIIEPYVKKCGELTGRKLNDSDSPLILKVVVSSGLVISNYPALHNYGLTEHTVAGFSARVGEKFGYHEILFLLKGFCQVEQMIAERTGEGEKQKVYTSMLDNLNKLIGRDPGVADSKALIKKACDIVPDGFLSDAYVQLEVILSRISYMLSLGEDDVDGSVALVIQPMVFGNYSDKSASGRFFTRDIITGERRLQGFYSDNTFDISSTSKKDIYDLDSKTIRKLEKYARIVEEHFREIRCVRFVIEDGKIWFIDQRSVMTKSTQSDIKTLLDLHQRKSVDDGFLINAVKPKQLNDILHPVIDLDSVKGLSDIPGGIAGSPGACVGRIFFSTDALIESCREAQQNNSDSRRILCLVASFAEDVKAIEMAEGVLSSEGGFSAHASVVARQYGKISVVNPKLKIGDKSAVLEGYTIKEGDYITLSAPNYGDPHIYLGQARLRIPSLHSSGLLDYIAIAKKNISNFGIRANVDKAADAELALLFGADGIGLCRTEHMFFGDDRINAFRRMILSSDPKSRKRSLQQIKKIQKKDFYDLFKVMAGKPVTIRLLDAPFHEFLPHNEVEIKGFLKYLNSLGEGTISRKELDSLCDSLREFNPMLGHRGCRIAVTYPEIYEMQVEAIFEAVYQLMSEKVKVFPELMIPLIMNEDELKLVIHGKNIEGSTYKGILQVERDVREATGSKPAEFKIGTMVELPAAAISAGKIAKYAEFFSFGTNDLTQTTLGISRDDCNSFMPDYTLYDIVEGNPFETLDRNVKELVTTAIRRSTMVRPSVKLGLCGEHGANPNNIRFCKDNGLNYVSCSIYSIPMAILATAQVELGE